MDSVGKQAIAEVRVDLEGQYVEAYGEKFTFELFRFFAKELPGAICQIGKRQDGVTHIRRLN